MEKLELIELTIDDVSEETGVEFISLVDAPAIESNWMAFNKMKSRFRIDDEEKRIVSGYAMIADLPIYRRNGDTEFYVVFRKDTIKEIVFKAFKTGKIGNTNIMHETPIDGVFVFESLLIDSKRKVFAPDGFEKVPDGSWWVSMRVDNEEVWQSIKDGTYNGFSIEGNFPHKEPKILEERTIDRIKKVIQEFTNYSKLNNMKESKTMDEATTLTKIRKILFGKTEEETKEEQTKESFVDATLADGTLVQVEPDLQLGATVSVATDNGVEPLADGTYELSSGESIVVADGVITEIIPLVEEQAEDKPTEAAEEQQAEKVRKIVESIEKHFNEEISKLKEDNKKLNEEVTAFKAELKEKDAQLFDAIKEIVEEPKHKPTQKRTNPLEKTNLDGLVALRKVLKTNKIK